MVSAVVLVKNRLGDLDALIVDHDLGLKSTVCYEYEAHDEAKDDTTVRLQRPPVVLEQNFDLLREHVELKQALGTPTLSIHIYN